MSGVSIFRFQDVVNLAQLKLNPGSFKFDTLSIQSDKFIAAREMVGADQQLTIVDLPSGSNIMKFPMKTASAAMMHPKHPIVAIRGGSDIQLLNVAERKMVTKTTLAEELKYWTWINDATIAMVTSTNVYHWTINTPTPRLMFARDPSTSDLRITSYSTSSDETWCILVGITVRDGQVAGSGQLYSVTKAKSQIIPAIAATFCSITSPSGAPTNVFGFVSRDTTSGFKLHIIETNDTPIGYQPKQFNFNFTGMNMSRDFPFFASFSARFGFLTIFSKFGNIVVFDVPYGAQIIPPMEGTPIFNLTAAVLTPDRGNFASLATVVAPDGAVKNLTVDTGALVPFVTHTLGKQDLAFQLAVRAKLSGGEELFRSQFERLFAAKNYTEAAQLVLKSGPNLRTETTMQRFYREQTTPGHPPPIFQYFSILSGGADGKLNEYESYTLAGIVLNQGKLDVFQTFFNQDKIECSLKLGDAVKNSGLAGADVLALKIYNKIKAHDRVILWMVEHGQADKITSYIQNIAGSDPTSSVDFMGTLRMLLSSSPEGASKLAILLVNPPPELQAFMPQVNPEAIVRLFEEHQYVREAAAVLLELCRIHDFDESTAEYQTRVLEITLSSPNPEIANAMLDKGVLQHFDHDRVAKMCESSGLYERALSMYANIEDVKRCVVHTESISPEFFVEWSSQLTPEDAMIIYREMLANNRSQKTITLVGNSVIQAQKEHISPNEVMELMLSFGKNRSDNKIDEAMYYYLGAIVHESDDPEVHYQYVVSATRMHNSEEVVRMCRESRYLEEVSEKLRDFLMDAPELKSDPRQDALGQVCSRYGFVEDAVKYYFKTSKFDAIEHFVVHINPSVTGTVVGMLLDMDCDKSFIAKICMAVRSLCDVNELSAKLEERNRLRLLKPMVKARIQEGVTDIDTHTAFGKVIVECEMKGDTEGLDMSARDFIQTNPYFNHNELGHFCEKREPTLSFMCYATDSTANSYADIIRVSNENALHKNLARFLVNKDDPEVWGIALGEETNPEEGDRKSLIDQVISTAIPEACARGEENPVTTAIRAFKTAELNSRLIELLEKIVLDHTASEFSNVFAQNQSLQTLLVVTAINTDSQRVNSYIKRLEHFDADFVASAAIKKELYEEAFEIYNRFQMYVKALDVLLAFLGFARADEYARRITGGEDEEASLVDPAMGKQIWSSLGRAQLEKAEASINGMLSDADVEGLDEEDPSNFYAKSAITSFINAEDPTENVRLVEVATQLVLYNEIIPYLRMARAQIKDSNVDTALCNAYARADRLAELSEFVEQPNLARVQHLAELLFEESTDEMVRACVILYSSISNWASLTSCYLFLSDFQSALSSAKKANSTRTWQQVMMRAVEAEEFSVASFAGNNLVLDSPDELEIVIEYYEQRGFIPQLLELLESAILSERAQKPLFTSLGKIKAKYQSDRLAEYLEIHIDRLNSAQLIQATKRAHLWPELVILYMHDEEFDNAAETMISYPNAWDHNELKKLLDRCVSLDLMYRAIRHYIDCRPHLLNNLLLHLCAVTGSAKKSIVDESTGEKASKSRIDPSRVISMLEPMGLLPLIREFLLALPGDLCDNPIVNASIHKLLIASGDCEELLDRCATFRNFDMLELAGSLEGHPSVQMRRVAVELYRTSKRYSQAIRISKRDLLFGDCMQSAELSCKEDLCEDLLRWFLEGDITGEKREGVALEVADLRQLRSECFSACLFRCFKFVRPDVVLELAYLHGMVEYAVPFFIQTIRNAEDRLVRLEAAQSEPRPEPAGSAPAGSIPPAESVAPGSSHIAFDAFSDGSVGFADQGQGFASMPPGGDAFAASVSAPPAQDDWAAMSGGF
eukprot:gnl/Chilomastix_cuspidata/171.p1 GENE.gnl/Chilomastix_cuspidata/171~~gnl/Chilomastix_cuspidata/171.p1  ORF type:complete len:1855 (+),score=838.99 gnl/Chilomastix_cuspidata/171:43-5565(+)